MKPQFTADEIAAALDVSRRAVNARAGKEQWARSRLPGSAKAWAYDFAQLPDDVRTKLTLRFVPAALTKPDDSKLAHLSASWSRKSERAKQIGTERLQIITAVNDLVARGKGKLQAIAIVAGQSGKAAPSIRRWLAIADRAGEAGAWAVLTPRWAGRVATVECSPEAWDYFKVDYLRLERPCAQACYERLQRAARDRDWTVPSLRTMQRRLEREITPAAVVQARHGDEAARRMLMPTQERDRSIFHAMEAVNADGHKWDVFVKWPDGEVGRPCTVVWQDLYSGKLLGYRTDKTENAESVRLSLGDVVDEYGVPSKAWLDNGRGFASKWITGGTPNRYRFKVKAEDPSGVLTLLNVQVHWATPYHGQAKPIERAFRDLCEYVAKHPAFAGAYVGNKPDAKPENYGSHAVPFDQFETILKGEIAAHNMRVGRRTAVCDGRSFDEAFATSYATSTIRKAPAQLRALLLLAAEGVTADGNDASVRIYGNRYWTDDHGLALQAGRKLVVRFDPKHLDRPVHIYRLNGAFIATAPRVEKSGFETADHGREWKRQMARRQKAVKGQLAAERRMSIVEAASLVPTPAPAPTPETNVVRAVFAPITTTTPLAMQPAAMPREEFELNFSNRLAAMREAKGLK